MTTLMIHKTEEVYISRRGEVHLKDATEEDGTSITDKPNADTQPGLSRNSHYHLGELKPDAFRRGNVR